MMDLDPTGARANDPGLTRDALKAEKRAKSKARWAAFWARVRANVPLALVYALVVAILASATLFDWYMSSRGWQDILPGLGVFAFAGAAAAVGFWYFGSFQVGAELYKNKALPKDKRDHTEAIVWTVVSVVAYFVCVGGVLVATLTNTAQAKMAAEDSRRAYTLLIAERDELAEYLETYSVDYWEQRVLADERTAKGRLNIAKATLGMADLDVDGGCAQKLNFNQLRACAYWNGGTDPATGVDVDGILSDIEQDKAGLAQAQVNAKRLGELKDQVRTYKVKVGDETTRALAEYFESETTGNQVMILIITLFSAGFLLCGGLFGHGAVRLLRKAA